MQFHPHPQCVIVPHMRRRWIIRIGSIFLLLLCLSAWAWSLAYSERLAYVSDHSQDCIIDIEAGKIFLGRNWGWVETRGWNYQHLQAEWDDELESAGRRWLGFQVFTSPPPVYGGMGSFVKIPFWFPTAICTGLLWFVWRITRPQFKGRAFPIDPKATSPIAAKNPQ